MVKYLETKKRKSQKNKTKKNIGGAPHKEKRSAERKHAEMVHTSRYLMDGSPQEKNKTPEKRSSSSEKKHDPNTTFKVTVLKNKNGDKIYECPECGTVTGTEGAKYPKRTSLFAHNLNCTCKGKIPVEK